MADNEDNSNQVDDQGTSEAEGRELLKRLRDAGFEGSDEKLALALGRPAEEIEGLISGTEPVDDDIIIKARGIAKEREFEVS
ncbi:MAG TPA: hypothetical protein VNO50_15630 [Pyrinomonadaceae bacterium]|nr:hypothetical protein [Pyrinomonadaceae bacterium]